MNTEREEINKCSSRMEFNMHSTNETTHDTNYTFNPKRFYNQ